MSPGDGSFRNRPAPTGIFLANTSVVEQTFGAIVGPVTVYGGFAPFAFSVHDELENGALWEVVSGILKLRDDQEVFFVDAPARTLDITVTTANGKQATFAQIVAVQELIIPPPPNRAPTDVLLDNLTVQGAQAGAVVGNLTAVDPDLPGDTDVMTVMNDARFVCVATSNYQAVLQLVPLQQIDPVAEPTVTLVVRATDSGGLFVEVTFVIVVLPVVSPGEAAFSLAFSLGFAS